jgi:hypothetical protein
LFGVAVGDPLLECVLAVLQRAGEGADDLVVEFAGLPDGIVGIVDEAGLDVVPALLYLLGVLVVEQRPEVFGPAIRRAACGVLA